MTAKEYISGIMDGSIVCGNLTKKAVMRHLNDLEHGQKRGLYFDEEAGERAIEFFKLLKHSKGKKHAGKPFELAGWQKFIVSCLFGWKNDDGTRRFRTSYTEVAKKNGKSTLAAGIGLFMMIADHEPGAEVYSAAISRDQAKIVFNEAKSMIKKSTGLLRIVKPLRDRLYSDFNGSIFSPLSSDYNTLEGKNPYCAIIDEFHAHKNDLLFSNLQTATVSRDQSLIWVITTAGYGIGGACHLYRKMCVDILEENLTNDGLFTMIFTMDDGDDWTDEVNWSKSNPNLGVSVEIKALRAQYQEAVNQNSKETAFKTKNLNIWVGAAQTWIKPEIWRRNKANRIEPGPDVDVYGSLDLSGSKDTTCFGAGWDTDGVFNFLPTFWIPTLSLEDKMRRDHVNYMAWINDGYVRECEGDTVNYDDIYDYVVEFAENHNLISLQYDPWNATQVVIRLKEYGIEMVPYPQRVSHMNVPCKHMEKLAIDGKLNHMGNPVMEWMISNAWVKPDANDNIMINKGKSYGRVDGAVCMAMSIGGFITQTQKKSVYEERGIITIGGRKDS